jgi:hypothetical protein
VAEHGYFYFDEWAALVKSAADEFEQRRREHVEYPEGQLEYRWHGMSAL